MDSVIHPSDPRIAPHLAALDATPAHQGALAALEAAYGENEQWDSLLRVYEHEALRVDDPRARAELYFAMGRVWEDRIGNRPQAMRHYQLAFRADPRARKSLAAAERIYRELNHHGMVVRLVELQIEVEEEPVEKAALYTSLGKLLQHETGDVRRAIECFERALALHPDHNAAAEALAPLAAARTNWEETARAYRVQAKDATDEGDRVAYLLQAAELTHREDRGAPEAEIDLRRALEIDPDSQAGNELLASILLAEGRHDELTQHLEKRAKRASDPALRASLLQRLAEHALARGDETASLAAYDEILTVDPGQQAALAVVIPSLRRRRAYDELFTLADRVLETGQRTDAHAWVLREAGEVAWRERSDQERAQRYLGALREIASHDPLARAFFRPAAQPAGEYKTRYTELGRQARAESDPAKKRELHRQAALIAEGNGAAPKEAIDSWRAVLEQDKSDGEAREHLKTLYRKNERWHALVEVLKQEVEQLPPERVEEKIGLYEEMSDVYATKLSMEPMVVNTLHAVLHVAPTHGPTLDRLAKIYERRESWGQLADILGRKADATSDAKDRLQLLHRSAEIWQNRLQSPEDAIRRYEQVLSIDARDERALSALRKIYEQRRAYEPLVQIYLREVDVLPTKEERQKRSREIAEWAQKHLHRPARLIELWNKVLENDEHDDKALVALANLYEREERWQALGEILMRRIAQVSDKRERVQARKRLGTLLAERLGREDRAMVVWEQALDEDPDNAEVFKILRDRHVKAKAFEALEALYGKREKWEEYVDVLVVQAEALTDTAEKTLVYFQIAEVWEERLQRKDRAARVYERILEIDPRSVRAAQALRPIFEKASEWRKLATVEEVLAAAASDPQDRASRHRRIATLYEEKLRRPSDAFAYVAKALEDDPALADGIIKLEQLAEATGLWAETAAAFEKAIARAEEMEQRQDLALRAARIFDERLNDAERAIAAYEAVRKESALHAVAVPALRRLYQSENQWAKLLGLRKDELAAEESRAAREKLLFAIASLEEEYLSHPLAAIAAYEEILTEDPASGEALTALARLYEGAGNHGALAKTLEQSLELAVGADERVPLLLRLGHLAMTSLADPLGAVRRFQELLAADPEHAGAEAALESLMHEKDSRAAAAMILVERHRARSRWERSLPAFAALVDTADGPAERVELLLEMGRVQENELRRLDYAYDAYTLAFREDPADPRPFAEADRLCALLDNEGAFADLLASELDRVESRRERARIALRAAELFGVVEKTDKSIDAYAKALDLGLTDEDARAALRSLARLYDTTSRWDQLKDTLQRAIDVAETAADRKALLLRKGALLEDKLGMPGEAAQAYRDALTLDPDHEIALARLDVLYQASKEWGRLAEVLASKLRNSSGRGESSALQLRLGHLLAGELQRSTEALHAFRAALEIDPDSDEAVSAIETLVELDPELHVLAAETLAPIYELRGQNDKVQAALEALLPARPPEERVAILHRVGGMSEEGGNTLRAYESYARALHEDPTNAETRERLGRVASKLGRWGELLLLLDAELDNINRTEDALKALGEMSRAAEVELGDTARAAEYARKMAELVPEHEGAFDRLADLYERERRYADLVALITEREGLISERDVAKRLALRKAELAERELADNGAAIAAYRKAEALDPEDDAILLALLRLYGAEKRHDDLVTVHLKRADLATSSQDARGSLVAAAEILEHEIGDDARAIELYRRVSEADRTDTPALQALARLYESEKMHSALKDALSLLAQGCTDEREQIELRYRIAALTEGPLGDPAHAVDLYLALLESAPDHQPTITALEGQAESGTERLRSARALKPRYESRGEWAAFVRVAEIELGESDAPDERLALLRRIAAVQEQELSQRDRAFTSLQGALLGAPQDDATLADLERIATEDDRFADLADVYRQVIDGAPEPALAKVLGHKLAHLYDSVLHEPERAITEYKRVLSYSPDDLVALRALDRLYTGGKRHADLAETLRREIEVSNETEEVVGLHYRLGAVLEKELGDSAGATAALGSALALDDQHSASLLLLGELLRARREVHAVAALLGPIYRKRSDWENVASLLEVEAEVSDDATARKNLYVEIAEIQEERLQSWTAAFAFLARALHEDPADEEIVAELTRVADESGEWEELAIILDEERERVESETVREHLALHVAQIHVVYLKDRGGAVLRYDAIVKTNPRCVAALRALDRLHTEGAAYQSLARVLALEAETSAERADEVGYLLRLAEVEEKHLTDGPRAITTLRTVLERSPGEPAALDALERIYAELDEPGELFEIYQQRLVKAEPEDRARLLAALARLAGNRLGRADEAIELWLEVENAAPGGPDALLALESLYEKSGRYAELADVLSRRAGLTSDEHQRVAILAHRAEVEAQHLGNDEDAIVSWQAVLDARPTDEKTLLALSGLYARTRRHSELAETLERRLALQRANRVGPEEMVVLLAELAHVQGALLMMPDAAAASWTRVLEMVPDHAGALDALEKLYSDQGDFERVIAILELRARLEGGEDAEIAALFQVAELRDRRMGDPDGAALVYERILENHPEDVRASELLEQLYERLGNHERVAELLLGRLESMNVSWERLTLLRRIADIYLSQLARADMAFIVLCRALREDPRDAALLGEVERLAESTGNFEELANLFEDMLAGAQALDELAFLHSTVARYYADSLARPDLAAGHYRAILELDPDHGGALTALEALLRREGQLVELGTILRRKATLAVDLHEKKTHLYALAELCEGSLDQPADAAAALEEVLRLEEGEEDALGALRRIYRRIESWSDLIRVLQRQLTITHEPGEALRIRKEVAALFDRALGDSDAAADVYREMLATDPGEQDAVLELERILTVQRRWDELVFMLGEQVPFARGPAQEIELHEKLGALFEERLGKSERAIESYRAILRISPRHLDALDALERLFASTGSSADLADVLERRATAAESDADRVVALRRLGATYEQHLDDPGQAIGAYQRVLELAEGDPDALVGLGRIHEAAGDPRLAVDSFERAARAVTERRKQAELWHQVARISHERLRDKERAEGALRYSIGADPTYLPALATLRGLFVEGGDYRRALDLLAREDDQTHELRRKVELACEMGRLAADKLGDVKAAVGYYEVALEREPDSLAAARPLADLYYKAGDFARARGLLELVRRRAPDGEADAATVRFRLAEATLNAGDEGAALTYFQEAYEADLAHLPTLLALGSLLFKRQEWERAFKVYQSIVVHHSEAKGIDTVDVYYRLGVIRARLGERRKAIHSFDKALEQNDKHAPTLRELCHLYEESQEWEEAALRRKQLVDATDDPTEKLELAVAVGDLYRERLGNTQRAIDAYLDALDLEPHDLIVLHKLLELYTETKQWARAIDVLEQIAAREKDAEKLGTYLYSIGVIYRDELKDPDAAIDYFNRTLDANPTRLKAFEAIDKISTARRDWATQASAYRAMLARLPAGSPLELQLALWRGLGEILRTRMHDLPAAIPCYEKAHELAPNEQQHLVILSELYEQARETYPRAIEAHRALLAADKDRMESYHALYRLYRGLGEHDRAYWMCHVLRFINELDQGELQYLEQVRQVAPKRPARPLDERLWHLVLHPTEDRVLGGIFALLTGAIAPVFLANPRDLGVNKKNRIETGDLQIFFSRIFQLSRGVLGVAPPEVYLKQDDRGIKLANTAPVTMVVGPDMVQDRPEHELSFALAKNLSYLRPEHFLSALLPPYADMVFYAGVRTCFPTQKLPDGRDAKEIDELAKRIRKALPPAAVAQLQTLLQQFYKQGRHFDAQGWLSTVELTANRAGLVVCNDLAAADTILQQEPFAISTLTRQEKREALLEFALSDDYFQLRAGLGLAVPLQQQ